MSLWLIADAIALFFTEVIIKICSGLFRIADGVYTVFLILARTNIFSEEHYRALVEKVYIVLAVVMLFVVAYNFLMLIVDPDKDKGGASTKKMLKDIVISFILIVLTPSLFTFAYDVQNAILDQDTIGGIFRNSNDAYDKDGEGSSIAHGGDTMAAWTFRAFFEATGTHYILEQDFWESFWHPIKTIQSSWEYMDFLQEGVNLGDKDSVASWLDEKAQKASEDGSFSGWAGDIAPVIMAESIDFHWIACLIAGCYLIYVLLNFCFDLAVRVVKLAFYQIIAPLCIALRVVPKAEKVFKSWWNAVYKTFMAVFVRVFLMHLTVYLISIFINDNAVDAVCADSGYSCGGFATAIAKALIILGILTFMRQAPKLIDEIFGLGDVKLGLREHLRESGALAMGAAAGAGITATTRGITHGLPGAREKWREAKGQKGFKNRLKQVGAIAGLAGNTLASGIYGTVNGGKQGWTAKTLTEMKNAAKGGAQKAVNATQSMEDKVQRYRGEHPESSKIGAVVRGTLGDVKSDIKDWATGGPENAERIIKKSDKIKDLGENVKTASGKIVDKLATNNKLFLEACEIMEDKDFKTKSEDDLARRRRFYEEALANGYSIAQMREILTKMRSQDPTERVSKKAFESEKRELNEEAWNKAREEVRKLNEENARQYNKEKAQYDLLKQQHDDKVREVIASDAYQKASEEERKAMLAPLSSSAPVMPQLKPVIQEPSQDMFFETKVTFDEAGYKAALENAQRELAADIASYSGFIEDITKKTTSHVTQLVINNSDKALKDNYDMGNQDVNAVRVAVNNLDTEFKYQGYTVTDPSDGKVISPTETGEDGQPTYRKNDYSTIKDMVDAFERQGLNAQKEVAAARIKKEHRDAESKK